MSLNVNAKPNNSNKLILLNRTISGIQSETSGSVLFCTSKIHLYRLCTELFRYIELFCCQRSMYSVDFDLHFVQLIDTFKHGHIHANQLTASIYKADIPEHKTNYVFEANRTEIRIFVNIVRRKANQIRVDYSGFSKQNFEASIEMYALVHAFNVCPCLCTFVWRQNLCILFQRLQTRWNVLMVRFFEITLS